jgi:signal transduction histidine kinase
VRIGAKITLTAGGMLATAVGLSAAWVFVQWREQARDQSTRELLALVQGLGGLVEARLAASVGEAPGSVPLLPEERLRAAGSAAVAPWKALLGGRELVVLPLDRRGEPQSELRLGEDGSPRDGDWRWRQRERARRVAITLRPGVEELSEGGFVATWPLRGWPSGGGDARERPPLAILELVARGGAVQSAARRLAGQVLLVGLSLEVLLLALLWRIVRRGIERPVDQLVEGVRDVAAGDLSRVLFAARKDELGTVATCFNEMTASLRGARQEARRSVEARFALEARLRHSEKLATIGQLSASIAHELGTPLNVIAARARTVVKKASDGDEVRKNAEIISEQTATITKIIQQILDFTRQRAPVRTQVSLAPLVRGCVELLEAELRARQAHVLLAVEAEAPTALGDPDQLQQVCLNLLLNGAQAMPAGGPLRVRLAREHRRRPGLDAAPPQALAVLEVADQGVGIPAEDRERIFEPFYSTKREGEGTGLGLSIAQGILKDHDGWIELESETGRGTTVRVLLPELAAPLAPGEG